jgi:hypothetical protein
VDRPSTLWIVPNQVMFAVIASLNSDGADFIAACDCCGRLPVQ